MKKLETLFDYQKFENDEELDRIINSTKEEVVVVPNIPSEIRKKTQQVKVQVKRY